MYVLPQNLVGAFRGVIVFHLKNKVILLWYATVLEFFAKIKKSNCEGVHL